MRIMFLSLAVAAVLSGSGVQAASSYTKIDDAKCETLKTYEDGGVDLRCPGLPGLDVFVSEGDARLDVDYGLRGENFETFSAFNNIGDTVEWLSDAKGVPQAAIIRYLISVDGREAQALVVSRINTEAQDGCVIGVVDAKLEQANGIARGIGAMAATFDCSIDPVVIAPGASELVQGFSGANQPTSD
ncbi:MAG: hypothetical protein EON57_01710 [Alphaproteobacteria bacterium]|nr:MAG: hypothetical protein EON57_01710 [Alphaproteobacteria bacterium]